MRRITWVVLGIAAVLVVALGVIFIFRPSVVLPTVVIVPEANSPIRAYQQQLGVKQFDMRIRTDGKVYLGADGKDAGYVSYNPTSLGNALRLASRTTLPHNVQTVLEWLPIAFPRLTTDTLLTSQVLYSVLPVELTLRFVNQ